MVSILMYESLKPHKEGRKVGRKSETWQKINLSLLAVKMGKEEGQEPSNPAGSG